MTRLGAHVDYTAELHLSFENSANFGECGALLMANVTARVPSQFAAASGMARYTVCSECWGIYVKYRDEDDTRRQAFLRMEKRFQNLESGKTS